MAVICILVIVAVGLVAYLSLSPEDEGWEDVPRKVYEFDQYPGDEVVIRGRLEANDRKILAIPKAGDVELITEKQVDAIVQQGLRDEYDFRNPGWTHRLRADLNATPSFEEDGVGYYVLINSGTEAWSSEDVYSEFEGRDVEILGKWDNYTDPIYHLIGVVQFRGKSIRAVD